MRRSDLLAICQRHAKLHYDETKEEEEEAIQEAGGKVDNALLLTNANK
jgi:hypothetical protein